jgi:pSer/pThr/pTyr-binding forkhead associated (FHA) protein
VRISDISVSRDHAEIVKINGEFYIKDLKSKFGTLIQSKEPIHIQQNRTLTLQAGRTLLRISLSLPSYCGCYM